MTFADWVQVQVQIWDFTEEEGEENLKKYDIMIQF